MNIILRDISNKKEVKTKITINIRSLINLDLFLEYINKYVCRCGRNCDKKMLHEAGRSTRNIKYYMKADVVTTEKFLKEKNIIYYKYIKN